MNEYVAVGRFIWSKHRIVIVVFMIVALMCQAMFLLTKHNTTSVSIIPDVFGGIAYMVFLAAMLWGLFALDCSQVGALELPESGYSPWLMRTPISNAKLALVPLLAKSAWVIGLWCVFVLNLRVLDVGVGVVGPAAYLAGFGMTISAIAWRPFRNGLLRMIVISAASMIWFVIFGVIMDQTSNHPGELRFVPWLNAAAVLFYLVAFVIAYRTIPMARVHRLGIAPPNRSALSNKLQALIGSNDDAPSPVIIHDGPIAALRWHDLQRCQLSRTIVTLLCQILFGLVVLVFDLPTELIIPVVVMLCVCACFSAASTLLEPTTHQSLPTLPPYLATIPLSSTTFAYSRLRTLLFTYLPQVAIAMLLFAVAMTRQSNRDDWYRWVEQLKTYDTMIGSAASVGLRMSLAIALAFLLLAAGRMVSAVWVGMSGRSSMAIATSVVAVILFCLVPIIGLNWFYRFNEWAEVTQSLNHWLTFVPWFVGALLAAKSLAVIGVLSWAKQTQAVQASVMQNVLATWLGIVIGAAIILHQLVPDIRCTFAMSLAYTALVTPLARLLVLPIAVHFNRHR